MEKIKNERLFRKIPLKALILFLILTSITSFITLLSFQLVALSTNVLLSSARNGKEDLNYLYKFIFFEISSFFCTIFSSIARIFISYIKSRIINSVYLKFNRDILTRINNLSLEQYNKNLPSRELFSLLANDSKQFVTTKIDEALNMWDSAILVIFVSAGVFYTSWVIGLIMIIGITLMQLLSVFLTSYLGKRRLRISEANNSFNKRVGEYLDNFSSLYFYGFNDLLVTRTNKVSLKQIKETEAFNFVSRVINFINSKIFGQGIRDTIVWIIFFLILFYPNSGLDIGHTMAISGMFYSLWPRFQAFFQSFISIRSLRALASKIRSFGLEKKNVFETKIYLMPLKL